MRKLFYVTAGLLIATIGWLVYQEVRGPARPRSVAPSGPTPAVVMPEERPVVPALATERSEAPVVVTQAAPAPAAATPQPVTSPVPAAVTQAQADESLRKADAFSTAGDKVKARLAYTEALKAGYKGPRLEELKDKLTALSDEILFSAQPCPEAISYTVSAADSAGLASIAKRYDTTYQLIARINRKKDANIRVGETLKIIPGPFEIVVHKRTFRLEVYLKGAFIKRYRIGLGLNGSTPEGEFKVTSKLIKPAWFRPGGEVPYGDPENPLGTRWIGFVNEYGIHGTWEPESIGKEGSRGCVRMLNADVEELYDLLVTGKSRVTVLP